MKREVKMKIGRGYMASEGGDRGGLETRAASAIFRSWDKIAHLAINVPRRTSRIYE